jgi:hypothetical protein
VTRAAVIVGLVLAVLVPSSSGANGDRTYATPGAITRLAADGPRVAALTAKVKGSCDKVVVWNAKNGNVTTFATREACPHADVPVIPYTVEGLALGDGQVAWIAYTGGNETETLVYAARLTARKAKEIDFLTYESDSGEGDDAQHLLGGGSTLAYNRLLGCTENASGGFDCDVRLARIRNGAHEVARGETLLAAAGTRMVALHTKALTLLAPDGSRVAVLPGSATERTPVAAGATRVTVRSPRALDVYDAANGSKLTSLPLGAAAGLKLVGVSASLALFRSSGRAALMRLRDGTVAPLTLKGVVDARLTDDGLFYAYNTPTATQKGHVAFEPTARLLQRF